MASFLEFLNSGKTAKEFIDTSVLPQHVLPAQKTKTSPEPYENAAVKNEETDAGQIPADDILDEAVENMTDEDWKKFDEKYDEAFIAALEAAERDGFGEMEND